MKNKNKTTKFPVARIKRIMQKDEEVGKVAQATPVVISKALEMFLAMIVEEASNVTVERGSRKVEAYHLKHAIQTVEMLDFLKEIVETVPDPSAGGTVDVDAQNAEARTRRRGKGKDKKAAGDADGEENLKRRRRKAGDKTKGGEKEEQEMDAEDDDDEGKNGRGSGRRARREDDDDDDWKG